MTAIPITGDTTTTSGIVGRLARSGRFEERSKLTEGTTTKIGYAMTFGTTTDQVKPLELGTDKFAGIAVYDLKASDLDNLKYGDKQQINVAHIGSYWVYSEEIVNEKDDVRVRIVDDGVDPLKLKYNFCKTASAGKTVLLKGVKWDSNTGLVGASAINMSDNIEVVAD